MKLEPNKYVCIIDREVNNVKLFGHERSNDNFMYLICWGIDFDWLYITHVSLDLRARKILNLCVCINVSWSLKIGVWDLLCGNGPLRYEEVLSSGAHSSICYWLYVIYYQYMRLPGRFTLKPMGSQLNITFMGNNMYMYLHI